VAVCVMARAHTHTNSAHFARRSKKSLLRFRACSKRLSSSQVCMRARTHAGTHACMHARMHARAQARRVCACVCVCVRERERESYRENPTRVLTYKHAQISSSTYKHAQANAHTCILCTTRSLFEQLLLYDYTKLLVLATTLHYLLHYYYCITILLL
jgi:hypothetical protein